MLRVLSLSQVLYLSQVTSAVCGLAALCEEPLRLNGTEARGTDPMRIRRCRGMQPYERCHFNRNKKEYEHAIRNTDVSIKQES